MYWAFYFLACENFPTRLGIDSDGAASENSIAHELGGVKGRSNILECTLRVD